MAGTENPPNYAGGEVNTITHCFIAGAFRGISIDDNLLSPISAAYSTRVIENDIQICQILIFQGSQYGAGGVFKDNVLQATQARQGDASGTFGIYLTGFGNTIEEPYGEYGATCNYILNLANTAKRNRVRYSGTCSATGGIINAFFDNSAANSYNIIEYYDNTGAAGTWDSLGASKRSSNKVVTTV